MHLHVENYSISQFGAFIRHQAFISLTLCSTCVLINPSNGTDDLISPQESTRLRPIFAHSIAAHIDRACYTGILCVCETMSSICRGKLLQQHSQ